MNTRKVEWRLNKSLGHKSLEYTDLFIDDVYQSIWLERDRECEVWQFVAYDKKASYRSPIEPTMEAAKEHFNTYTVIKKLEGKP
jgi:hypothetical protein